MDLYNAPYISLSTFRRTGLPVNTPIWAARVADHLVAFSAGEAGKVKRLRNSGEARIAVCDMRGKLLGPWHAAHAELFDDSSEIEQALLAMRQKYGWQMWLADTGSKLTGKFNKRAYIRITPQH